MTARQATISDEPPDPSETSPGVVRVDDHARGDGRLHVRARRRGDGGRRAARRVPAAERTRATRSCSPSWPRRTWCGASPCGRTSAPTGRSCSRPGSAPTRSRRPPSNSPGGWSGARSEFAAAAGYVATEIAKEAPYYAGAFGAAAVTDFVSSKHALIFLAGTNLGAAAYEYVPRSSDAKARSSHTLRVVRHDWCRQYSDYYRVEPTSGNDRVLRRRDEGRHSRRGGPGLRHPDPRSMTCPSPRPRRAEQIAGHVDQTAILSDLGLDHGAVTAERWQAALGSAVRARSREQVALAVDLSLRD